MVVYDRPHVFINADETSLSTVRHSGRGMACWFRRSRASSKTRPRDRLDRSFTNTTLVAAACDCPGLQPLLPQVILARYTKRVHVPHTLQAHYRSCGFPFEFWHGTTGRVTPVVIRKWFTRLRQSVASYNPAAWIVLIMDCCTAHLDRASVAHLRRLGILVVFVPASLTWLLQLLDVYTFGRVKAELRQAEARSRANSADGQIVPGQWIKLATTIIRRELINRDWSSCFARLGVGENCLDLSTPVAELLAGREISPALPSRAEFALLVHRPADSDVTRRLHASILGHTLSVQRSHVHSAPPHSASFDMPVSAPAAEHASRRATYAAMDPRHVVDAFSEAASDQPTFLHPFQAARNYDLEGFLVGDA